MDWLMWTLAIGGGLLFALRLWLGPADSPQADCDQGDFLEEREDMWTAEALANYGTDTTVADLAAQGRADELRGLGYVGDITGERSD